MFTFVVLVVAIGLLYYAAHELVLRPIRPKAGPKSVFVRDGSAQPLERTPVPERGMIPTRTATPVTHRSSRHVVDHLVVAYGTRALVVLSLLTVVFWVILYSWYSLPDHGATPDFAFDKIPDHFNSSILRLTALFFLAMSLIYLINYRILGSVTRLSGTVKLAVVGLVVGAGIVNVFLYPVGALDVYNYIIELKLTYHYHQNPYVSTFAAYSSDPFSKFAFFLDVPLFYGPAWLLLSAVPVAFSGFSDVTQVLIGLKVFNFALLALTAYLIYRYQDDEKRGWLAAYIFLANPLVLFEGIGNAHNDVMMGLFLVAGVLALKKRSVLASPLLMLSVLVKFFTAALIPLFIVVMIARRWGRDKIIVSGLLSGAILLVVSLPWWAGGKLIGGLSNGTNISQGMNSASLFSLMREFLGLQNASPDSVSSVRTIFLGVFVMAVLLMMWSLRRGTKPEEALIDTFLLFSVLVSLLYPWYLIPVVSVIALRPSRTGLVFLIAATTLGLLYHPLSVWAWFNSGWQPFNVHLFQAFFLALPIVTFLLFEIYRLGFTSRAHKAVAAT